MIKREGIRSFFKQKIQIAKHLMLGTAGEVLAAKHLKKLGYTISEKNWTSHPVEIDLICLDGDELVFVEVKSRQGEDVADAIAAFHAKKQQNILRAAKMYLSEKELWHMSCRFDLICIYGDAKNVEHYKNVIELQEINPTRKYGNSSRGSNSTWQPW